MAVRDRRGARLRRAAGRGPLALVTVLYGAAAVLAAAPALGSFRSAYLAGGGSGYGETAAGDHGQLVYRFWLLGHQLAAGEAPWRDPYSFQPVVDPQLTLGGWPFGLPFWPLEAAFGPVVAWNVLLLATVVCAGLLTYAWLRSLGLGSIAAALGGLAFAIAPYRLAQSSDHLLGWAALFLPLALLAIERSRAAGTRRAAHAWGALAALALVSVPLSGQLHLALGAIPLVLAYALVRFARVPAAWVAGSVLLTVAVGLALRLTVVAGSRLAERRSLSDVSSYSAEAIDFVNRWHAAPSEELVYLGWLTPLLAVGGLIVLLRGRRALGVLLGLAALVPILLAFGTNLPLYGPLRSVVPPLQNVRVPGRLMPVADLALAALAAFAAAALAARLAGRAAVAAGACLLLLVGADLTIMPFAATGADRRNLAYEALAADAPGRVLELPLFDPGRDEGTVYNLYELQAARERPSGYSTLAPPRAFDFYYRFARLSCGAWLPGDREELRSLGVRDLVFHRGLYRTGVPGAWFAWQGLLREGYRPAAGKGAVTLFEPGTGEGELFLGADDLAEPAREQPYFCGGWDERRTSEPQAAFWVWGPGVLRLELRAPRLTATSLFLDGKQVRSVWVGGTSTISIRLEGRRWHPLVLAIPGIFETKPPYGVRLALIHFPWH